MEWLEKLLKELVEADKSQWFPWVVVAFLGALIGQFVKSYAPVFFKIVFSPLRLLARMTYQWFAPKNPFGIALNKYQRAIHRKHGKLVNPVGPDDIELSLENVFAPIRLISGSDEAHDLKEFIKKHQRFIVLGGPGSGKTTLMKSLVINLLDRGENKLGLIPVFIELRILAEDKHSIFNAMVKEFASSNFPGAERFVTAALQQGRMLIILDGLDEIGSERCFVISKIHEFCNEDDGRVNPNRLYVTCRETSYREKDLHNSIPIRLRVEPFSNRHMRIYLSGWPRYGERSALELYSILQENDQIRDICRNPLLLSILTGLYLESDRFSLPTSRNSFYDAAIDELMEQRPARKQAKLEFKGHARTILEKISLERLRDIGGGDPEAFSRDRLSAVAHEVIDGDFKMDDLIDELTQKNSIIKPAKGNWYTFNHRTIQEFLAAHEAFRSLKPEQALEELTLIPAMREVMLFYCGMISRTHEANLILQHTKDQPELAGSVLLNLTILPDDELIEQIVERLIGQASGDDADTIAPSLTILASLAQKKGRAFDSTRSKVNTVIANMLEKKGFNDVQHLATSLASNPELAKGMIPVMLVSQEQRIRHTGIQLLRDMDRDKDLHKLVEMLSSDIPSSDKQHVGKMVSSLIPSGIDELIDRVELFPPVETKRWPFENRLPIRIAAAIHRACAPAATGCRAIDNYIEKKSSWPFASVCLSMHNTTNRLQKRLPLFVFMLFLSVSAIILYYYKGSSMAIVRSPHTSGAICGLSIVKADNLLPHPTKDITYRDIQGLDNDYFSDFFTVSSEGVNISVGLYDVVHNDAVIALLDEPSDSLNWYYFRVLFLCVTSICLCCMYVWHRTGYSRMFYDEHNRADGSPPITCIMLIAMYIYAYFVFPSKDKVIDLVYLFLIYVYTSTSLIYFTDWRLFKNFDFCRAYLEMYLSKKNIDDASSAR